MADAWIGLLGVGIGSLVTLLASIVVPWIRDTLDRRRVQRELLQKELRDALLGTLAALLEYRQAHGAGKDVGAALARFGAANNQLTVRLTREQQPISDVVMVMVAMVQQPTSGVANMIGEAMQVLTLWARGDIATNEVIPEVEKRAKIEFSADRTSAKRVAS